MSEAYQSGSSLPVLDVGFIYIEIMLYTIPLLDGSVWVRKSE